MGLLLPSGLIRLLLLGKVHITSLNFYENLFFLHKLQNQTKHLFQLLKSFILPPSPVTSGFEDGFVLFFFIFFVKFKKHIKSLSKCI